MKKTTLEKLNDKQFNAYFDYKIFKSCLDTWKEKNPTYEKDLTLLVEYMNLELEVKTKKYLYEVALTKWGIQKVKEIFVVSE